MPEGDSSARHCIIIPFLGRLDQVERCVRPLLEQRLPETEILLVNDGTPVTAVAEQLRAILKNPCVHVVHHAENLGVAAARNTAIEWCAERDVEVVLMIDSDCLPGNDFIVRHLALHREYPDAACFGCGVIGVGRTFWAKLDKVMSWVHSVPFGEIRAVNHPYHLPTTNFSLKMSALPAGQAAFDGRLQTGEDALLIRAFRRRGKPVLFSPQPVIYHFDRTTFSGVFKHHYIWGYHQYFVQLNQDIAPRSFQPWYRALFLLAFIPCMPLFALLGAVLNLKPWARHKPQYLLFFPLVLLVWMGKAVAVAEAAARPHQCLREPAVVT